MATRTGSGFTDFVSSDIQSKEQVVMSGSGTTANRAFVGQAISELGKIGGKVFEATAEGFEDDIVRELQVARNEAYDEFQTTKKRVDSAKAQGKLSTSSYSTILRRKVIEIENKYPGFSSEVEDAKRVMGITPTSDLIKNEANAAVKLKERLYSQANEFNTLIMDAGGSIDWEKTGLLTSKVGARKAERALIESEVISEGGVVTGHSTAYLSNRDTIFRGISDDALALRTAIAPAIDSMRQGIITTESLTEVHRLMDEWQTGQVASLAAKFPSKADREEATAYMLSHVEIYREIVSGSKTPQGLSKNLETVNKMIESNNLLSFRDKLPSLARIRDLVGPRGLADFMNLGLLKSMSTGEFATTAQALSAWIGVNEEPSSSTDETVDLAVKASLTTLDELLKNQQPDETNHKTFKASIVPIAVAHARGRLEAKDYDILRKRISSPVFDSYLAKLPEKERAAVGATAFDVFNGSAAQHLSQFENHPNFEGVVYQDGKLIPKFGKSSNNYAGIAINQETEKLNNFFDKMVHYYQYKEHGLDTLASRHMLGEEFAENFSIKPKPISKSFRQRVEKSLQVGNKNNTERYSKAAKSLSRILDYTSRNVKKDSN